MAGPATDRALTTRQHEGAAATVHSTLPEATTAYSAFEGHSIFSPTQSPAWIRSWLAEVAPDFFVATLSLGGVPSFAVALEIASKGPFRVARYMGDRHANGNFSPLALSSPELRPADLALLIEAIGAARPDIDLLSLERAADNLQGRPNPLMTLPFLPSPNPSLAVDLSGGFDALLGRTKATSKRKRNRQQARRLEAAGGYRFVKAETPDEVGRFLGAFFEMKQQRFRKMGVTDVFAAPQVRRFFHRLFAEALVEKTPAFVLDGLEVAGELRAVTGSSRCGDRVICEFGAIREDKLSRFSPGDFLFFENIRRACEEGLIVYDFSVGDEPYKRLWSDMEVTQYDVLVPMNARGRMLTLALRGGNRIKALIKANEPAWRLAKALRRRRGNQEEQPAAQAAERSGTGENGGS